MILPPSPFSDQSSSFEVVWMFSESFRLLIFLLFSLFVFLSELIFLIVNICSYYVVHLSSLKFGWKPVTLSPVYCLFVFLVRWNMPEQT